VCEVVSEGRSEQKDGTTERAREIDQGELDVSILISRFFQRRERE